MIISCVGLKRFLLAIKFDVVLSSNIFNNLIYVFGCRDTTVLNQ